MDQNARNRLIETACAILERGNCLLAVGLDAFFDGNTDDWSIGVNLPAEQHIGVAGFREVLYGIKARPDVQDVFIELAAGEIPEPDDPEDFDVWPTACVAFIVTSAPLEEVAEWVEPLHPRDVALGWTVDTGTEVPLPDDVLRPGHHVVRVWLL